MSFEAIVDADTFSQFVANGLALTTEAKVHLTDSALELAAVDPANVAMVSQSLSAHAFESYETDGGTGVIGVNLGRLDDALGVADADDGLVHLRLDDETRKLHVESGAMEFTIALIDPDSIRQEPEIPDILDNLTARLVVDARELSRAATAAGLCSDHIAFESDPRGSTGVGIWAASAEGDTDDVRIEWREDDDRVSEQSELGDAESLFSLDYLKDILKPIPSGTEAVAHYGDAVPLFLDSEFADADGDLRFMLAPRIET